jgi:hypothetical protein
VTGQVLPHRITLIVSDVTKTIAGVRSLVAWDVDENDGQLTESELAFFAQDRDGNIWTMGEYPEEYDNGRFVGADSTWISGQAEAQAGVLVPGAPSPGHAGWVQGSAPDIEFLDCAVVNQSDAPICSAFGCLDHVTVIDERSPLDPAGGIQEKTYLPGRGLIAISAIDDPEGETLVLVETTVLDRHERWRARKQIGKLDRRGHEVSDVYATTPGLKRLWSAKAPA